MTPLESGISVVIPVYNSAETLANLVAQLTEVLSDTGQAYEVILVNDGSRDASSQVICDLDARYSFVGGISLMRNYGQHNALLCGIRAARYNTIVTMDDDLQHPPSEIHKLLTKLGDGFDVVYGSPENLQHSLIRNFLSRRTKQLLGLSMRLNRTVDISAFRAMRTELRDAFASFRGPNPMIDVMLSWGTTRFASVRVHHEPRRVGESNYTVLKLCNQAMLLITGFTTGPLRFATFVGLGFTLFGAGVFLYVLVTYMLFRSIPGFPFLASAIALFSGAQLFALGILGEYVGRIFHRTMDRPPYMIRSSDDSALNLNGSALASEKINLARFQKTL